MFKITNFVSGENNLKSNRRRNIQRKQKEMDSFINDNSLSGNSTYFTALTNPTTFTNNSTKSVPSTIASIKRYYKIVIYFKKDTEFN